MVVKAFCDKLFENEHEWNQFKEVYNLINEKYANIEEPIYILSNVFLSNAQIDVLILARKGIAILELKSYEGKIYGSENGEWVVITANGKEVSMPENLFQQLSQQKFAIVDKLKVIRKGNFERIEEKKLYLIQCWGYFNKGSTYDINQMGERAHIWFDIITANDLIEKMSFLKAGYLLESKDMDAIVKGLNLKPYSFEKPPIQEDSTFESNWNKELSVFIEPKNWGKILSKIKDSNLITVVGVPNIGKTTTIMNLANELKKSGYRIHEDNESLINSRGTKDKKDRKEYYNLLNNKNVFILDDLFGNTEYEPSLGNKWVNLIIDIIDSSVNQSRIIIGSRRDVVDAFLLSNNELSRRGLLNEFKNSIIELRFSDYDGKNRKEIFDKNLNFFHLIEKNKEAILNRNMDKITKELLLPGDISYFIQKAKENVDFQESDLDTYIDKAKQQINSIVIDIKSLDDYEKIFLYNLFINQNFSSDDLEAVYLHCLPQGLTDRDYFAECLDNFEGKFIKNSIEIQFPADKKYKLEFIHDVYKEAIEKLITTEKVERLKIEDILKKIHELIRLQSIEEWNTDTHISSIILGDSNYDTIKFNIYTIILRYYTVFNIQIKDLVFEILDSLSFGGSSSVDFLFQSGAGNLELEMPESCDGSSKFLTELFNNYDKFVEECDYFNALFKKDELKINIAYCLAYRLNSNIVTNFQDKLKELLNGNEDVKHLIAKCIIKHYDFLKEDNKKLLYNIGFKKSLLMQFLIHNYSILSRDLKDTLEKQIVSSDKTLLIETCKTFLLNYSFIPNEIRRHYDFVFCLKDELVIKEVGKAFGTWFSGAFKDIDYDKKRETPDKKVLDLYCDYLKNEKIVLENLEEMMGFYESSADYGTLAYSILDPNKDNLSNKTNPKWDNPFYSELKKSLEINMILLLSSTNNQKEKYGHAHLYNDAFFWYSVSGNIELFEKTKNILNENNNIKITFLEIIENHIDCDMEFSKNPFRFKIPQIELIYKLSKPPNRPEIMAKANGILDYIKSLGDNHSIEITKDDYS